MRKCLWVCVTMAIAGCFAMQASAQETIGAPAGTTIKGTTSQTGPAPRTGLLRRRDREVVTTVTPSTTTKVETTTPVTPPTTTTTARVSEPRTGLLARLRGRLGR